MPDVKTRYRFGPEPLGKGAYAIVQLGTHKETSAVHAVKVLLPHHMDRETALGRLRREIEVQQRLSHPNVMPIYEADPDAGWYSMPRAKHTMWDLPRPIDPAALVELLRDATLGLIAAHQVRLVHRDVSPRNVLYLEMPDEVSRWVVADWGVVRNPHGETNVLYTQVGHQMGTPGFAAPELDDDAHAADHRCDIYSLGRLAAWGASTVKLRQGVPFVPQGPFERLVEQTTAIESGERTRSLREVQSMLDEIRISLRPITADRVLAALRRAALVEDNRASKGALWVHLPVKFASIHGWGWADHKACGRPGYYSSDKDARADDLALALVSRWLTTQPEECRAFLLATP